MKKNLKKIVLLLAVIATAVLCFAFSASAKTVAASGSCGDNVTYTYNSSTGELVISGSGAMWDCSEFVSGPFYYSNIKSVVIENGVTTIGSNAFEGCDYLTSVTIPSSVIAIGSYAFEYCDGLTSITIPDSVTTIGSEAFRECTNLESVTLSKNLRVIADYAFYDCSGLKSIIIPDSVTTIGSSAFSECSNLESVTLSEKLRVIPDNAFYNCNSLVSITIPDSVTSIGSYAFYECTKLETVTLSEKLRVIPDYAFYNCDSLTSITIPESVTTIGEYAFYSCDKLNGVTIPEGVTSIGSASFRNCYSLESITVDENNKNYSNDSYGVLFDKNKTNLIQYPIGNARTSYVIPEGSAVNSLAFSGCKNLEAVTLPGSMTSIYPYAFYDCDGLKSITIPDNVTSIYSDAFYDCDGLESVTIENGVTSIGYEAFYSCDNLESVILGNKVKTIDNYAFQDCGKLKSITIPVTVTSIYSYAFSGCYSLENVYYAGTEEQWSEIYIDSGNTYLHGAMIYFNGCPHSNTAEKPRQDATCSAAGYTAGTYCSDCGEWISGHAVIAKLPHSFTTYTFDNNATCTEDGTKTAKCDNCPEKSTVTAEGSKTGHLNKTAYPQQNATCSAEGYTAGTYCSDCKVWIEGHEKIGKTSHSFTTYTLDNNATCTEDGTKTAKCDNCEEKSTLVVANSKINHANKADYPKQEPSCGAFGYTAGTYCPDCDKWLSGHKEIAKTSHSFTKYVSDKNATLFADGTKSAICDYGCGEKDTVADKGSKLVLGDVTALTATQTTSSITLTWKKGANATGYRLFYKLNGDISWRKCVSYTTETSYTFNDLPAGKKYTFAVRSVGKEGSSAIYGSYVTVATATKAVKPSTVIATQTDSQIRLAWNVCQGATGYRIYYKSDNSWKTLVSGTNANFYVLKDLKPGTKYTFAIRPYVKNGGTTIWSAYATFTTSTIPANPTVKVTAPSKGKLTVSWKAVSGADSYQVYYKTGNGSYKLYKTYDSVKNLTFKNLKSGTKYTFAVRAVIRISDGNIRSGYKGVSATVK